MATTFQLKRSSVQGKQPNIGDIQVGELAVNLADGILYSKNTAGNIIVVGSSTTSNVVEGTNLYFTNTRAVSALTAGSGISIASNGRITSTVTGSGAVDSVNGQVGTVVLTTANIAESGNLYFTQVRARESLSQGSGITYNQSTGVITANVTSVFGSTGAISNNQLLSAILAVDGVGSTLDADLLDGLAGGGAGAYALKANNLSVFASTTSAQLAGVISDETGSGSLVFATSPTFDGTPQVPTAANVTSNAMVASTLFVKNAIANLIDTAPTTLDTLNELAAALNDDPNFATTTATLIGNSFNQANAAFAAANTKVATVAGVTATTISNAALLDGIKVVDGIGSGLDADVLDGLAGGGSGFYALKANNLSVFASTTSAQLAGVISDETGSGSLVFATSPTLSGTPQAPTAAIGTANTMIATTAFAANASALSSGVVNPARVVGNYTSITGVGTIGTGTWQGSSISTTYTNAKITSITASTPITANAATGAVALSHANSGVVAGTYGNSKIIPVVTVNATGHVTGVSNVSIEAGSSVTVSNTAPSPATEGDMYWDEDLGRLFIYYNDGDSSQWVDASPSGSSIDTGNILLSDGNVLYPSLAFTNNTNLGIYREASNELAISVLGVKRANVNVSGLNVIGNIIASTNVTTGNVTVINNSRLGNVTSGTWFGSNIGTAYTDAKITSVAGQTGAISNNQLLSAILAVDGVGSTLDADLLDGLAGGGSGFYALKANNLSVFASTTSAQLAGVISDETGSGNLVFSTSPTFTGTPQVPTAAASTSNNMIASTAFAASASNLTSGTVNTARISGSYTGITGVGTITTGTWQGSSISTTYTAAKLTSVAATSPIATSGSTGAITLSHVNSGVSAATYGNATHIPSITVNATGHITGVTMNAAAGGGGGGGGDFNTSISGAVAANVTTVLTPFFTAPSTAGIRYVVRSVQVASIGSSANITADFSGTTYSSIAFANSIPVPGGSAVELLKRPKVMQPSDSLRLQTTSNNTLQAIITYETVNEAKHFGSGLDITSVGTLTTLHTANANSVIESILLSNDDTSLDVLARVAWTNASDTILAYLVYDLVVPLNGTVEILEAPKFLENGHKIRVYANQANRLEAIIAGKTV